MQWVWWAHACMQVIDECVFMLGKTNIKPVFQHIATTANAHTASVLRVVSQHAHPG